MARSAKSPLKTVRLLALMAILSTILASPRGTVARARATPSAPHLVDSHQDPGSYGDFVRRWYGPVDVSGKVFPVALPADGHWLNWINTFGAPRMRLIEGVWKQVGVHEGIDVYAERGSPIYSITAGVVENIGWTFYSGYRVGIRGVDGNYYFYAHMLPQFAPGIVKGARVKAGRRLGSLGNSGYGPEGTIDEFPPHLHFGLQQKSTWIDSHSMLLQLYNTSIESIRHDLSSLRSIDEKLSALAVEGREPSAADAEEAARLKAARAAIVTSLAVISAT